MLDYNVRGENIAVTDALREYVEKRLTKLNRYIEENRVLTLTYAPINQIILVKLK